ncbi:hypothetical protein PCNPT3_05830 [Psychromonas sp. CNPT3]|uniref:hypothetical protein n=1 Tax=Psychromonas sp. CNPT3 TaxID=314282 RepID=UPI00006E3C1A|nr:hypothetical protein [Psychromonas sp. CNPT3]AGH81108.1 hypothetical protein PCNPT3_05830 [Psychromonas sp. CNPT3]
MTANISNTLHSPLQNSYSHEIKSQDPAIIAGISRADATLLTKEGKDASIDPNVSFSDRAVKIQNISKEFFSKGGLALSDISKYIQRLEDDGFLSASQAQKLMDANEDKEEKLSHSTAKIVDFLSDFKEKVEAKNKQDPLIKILTKAQSMVENLSEMKGKTTAENVKGTLFELQSYLNSDQAKTWDDASLKSLQDVKSILSVTDQLALNPSGSKVANHYLQFSKEAM